MKKFIKMFQKLYGCAIQIKIIKTNIYTTITTSAKCSIEDPQRYLEKKTTCECDMIITNPSKYYDDKLEM